MYWPTSTARTLSVPRPLDTPLIALRASRRGNFFASLSKDGLGVWDVRPTVLQAAVVRSKDSLERWGENLDVFWSHDGHGLIILTSTSHLLVYQLVATADDAYGHPRNPSFPLGGGPGEGGRLHGWQLAPLGAAFVMGGCAGVHTQAHSILLALRHPPSILTVPWPLPGHCITPSGSHHPPAPLDGGEPGQEDPESWELSADWIQGKAAPVSLSVTRTQGSPTLQTMLTDDGRVYAMYPQSQSSPRSNTASPLPAHQTANSYFAPRRNKYDGSLLYPWGNLEDKAVQVCPNTRFGLVAVGTESGKVYIVSVSHPQPPRLSHTLNLGSAGLSPGPVTSLAWTSDGYALAAGYRHAWAVWSMGGRLNGWGQTDDAEEFMRGVDHLFWAPGNLDLFVLSHDRIHIIPFAKSATTSQHSPDNTNYAFLQMDDRVLVYRGADQPDTSVINPESDVWQHIKIPNVYLSTNWPIRYASISSDGKLVAVAGRRGLAHYSVASGRWKLFVDERQEAGFAVRGGLIWFHHVLVAAVEVEKTYQIRLYSRDRELADQYILHSVTLPSPVLVMSLLDNSLLVYTQDNNLHHFLILPTRDTIKLHLCGSISFRGIVAAPSRVRALSWLVPQAQKDLGEPSDDLFVATIIFLVDGKLVLLRPRRAGDDEVRYDLQVLADRIESYWTHLHGVGTLENSLWGYDGQSMRVWLDALTIEATRVNETSNEYEHVEESVRLDLDFYPLSILMDKGVIIGVDYEPSSRSLPFTIFKVQTGTYLFIPSFLRYHLSRNLSAALTLATNYSSLVYFAHSLEVLLHRVLEDETDELSRVIEFLDHFPSSLDVVVGCARKTDVERWGPLFDVVGTPRSLFEQCLDNGMLKTAAGYLLVLQNLEQLDGGGDTVRLLRLAMAAGDQDLCKDVLRFLRSVDESGAALASAMEVVSSDA